MMRNDDRQRSARAAHSMKLSATTGLVAAACAIAISSPAAADGNGGISPYGYGNIYGNIFGTTDSAARKPAPEPPSGGRPVETAGDAPSQPRSVQLLQRQQQQYLAWKTQSWDGKPISYTPAKWTTEKERADHCTSYAGEESCEPGYESYPSADEMARNATVDRVVDGALTLGLSEGVRALPVSEDIKPLLNAFAGFIGPEALVRTGVKLAPQIDRFLRTSKEVRAYEQAGGDVRALRQTLDEVGAKYDEASAASATGTGSAPVAVFDTYSADQVPAKLADFAQKTAADPQHPRTPFRNEVSGRPLLPDATASGKPITYDYVEAGNGNTLVRGDDGSSYALTSDGSGQLSIHELPAAAGKAPESTTTDSATQTQTPRTAASGTQESAPQPSTPRADAPDGAAGVATQDQSVQTDPAAGGLKGGGTGEPSAGQNPADPQPSTSKRPAPDDDSLPAPKRTAAGSDSEGNAPSTPGNSPRLSLGDVSLPSSPRTDSVPASPSEFVLPSSPESSRPSTPGGSPQPARERYVPSGVEDISPPSTPGTPSAPSSPGGYSVPSAQGSSPLPPTPERSAENTPSPLFSPDGSSSASSPVDVPWLSSSSGSSPHSSPESSPSHASSPDRSADVRDTPTPSE
ncbi:hypothetical protein [Microbacterium paraoxydans]|uniref:Uncharacterized protein n=1 Tax=Microbacterium paraoxydans TaxID=199592 RepID=A0ABS5IJ84_9MICO|nr:hypothetical protein [Microbacterium paraoxydans]MBS0022976.1 hypothetical protein [Microbacterium paraoxydans]